MREQIFFQASAIFATIITIYIIPLAGQRITSRLIRAPFTRKINWKQIRLIIIAVLATWGVLGTGFVILTPEISTALWSRTALRHIFALASGLLIGQITFFIPMGMGVREAILVSLSDPTASPTLITVAALTFRLEMLVGEITCAIGALLAEKFLAYIHNKR
ncbi:MAG TPA: hypothetical protein ENJ35_06735 [Gammaproteobacteria bacterium]|nr:hypothetical protein [Gammaproteobacteria bacterium]